MGMNYYMIKDRCEYCGTGKRKLHIGKNSHGCRFALHAIPSEGINTLEDWIKLFCRNDIRIEDEDGEEVSVRDIMISILKLHEEGEVYDCIFNTPCGFMGHRTPWEIVTGEFS